MNLLKMLAYRLLLISVLSLIGIGQLSAQSAPELLLPANEEDCTPNEITFNWDTVANAVLYKIQLSTSATWTNPDVHEETFSHPMTTFTFALPYGNTKYYWRVSASFTNNEYYSSTREFTTKGSSPAMIFPDDQSTCLELEPVFEWASLENAGAYHLQISNSTTFSSSEIIYENANVPSSSENSVTFSYILPNNFRNYYWRVSASYTDCMTEWSDAYLFSTKQKSPVPVNPEHEELGVPINTDLNWTEIAPSSVYDIELASDPNFDNVLESFNDISGTSTTIGQLNYNSDYYWRMRSELYSCVSDWSNTFTFKTTFSAPSLDQPYDNRICLELTSEFKWFQVQNSQSYQLQIASDSDFETIIVDNDNIFDLFYSATLPEGLADYFWRVRAKDQNNFGAWSDVREFSTTIDEVTPIYPEINDAGIPLGTTFRWQDVADGYGIYHFQLSTEADFDNLLFDVTNLNSTSYSLVLTENNYDYYWRVSASYSQCENDFSTAWKFRTIIAQPVLTEPADNSEDMLFSISFKWNKVPAADTYIFYMATTPNFTPLIHGFSGIQTNDYTVSSLTPDTRYYWKVKAVNEFGESEFSEVFTFVTNSQGPSVPLLQVPLIGADQIETDVTLRWQESDRADMYHIQVSTEGDFESPFVDIDTLVPTYYDLTGLLNNTTYFWHVSAINDSGETRFSKLGYFVTRMLPPEDAPFLLIPIDNAINQPVSLTLKWSPVTYAEVYEIQVAYDDTFEGDLIVDDKNLYSAYRAISGLDNETDHFWRVKAKNKSGAGPWSETYKFSTKTYVSVNDELALIHQVNAFPNPFGMATTIRFNLPDTQPVVINIYTALGSKVTTLLDMTLPAGNHSINWNASDRESGVYYYSIQIADYIDMKELILIK